MAVTAINGATARAVVQIETDEVDPRERTRIAKKAAETRWFRWSEIKRVSRAAAKPMPKMTGQAREARLRLGAKQNSGEAEQRAGYCPN